MLPPFPKSTDPVTFIKSQLLRRMTGKSSSCHEQAVDVILHFTSDIHCLLQDLAASTPAATPAKPQSGGSTAVRSLQACFPSAPLDLITTILHVSKDDLDLAKDVSFLDFLPDWLSGFSHAELDWCIS